VDIEDWRQQMDALDERLVDLLNRRSACAIEIGRIKHERGLPVYSPEREAQVLDHVARVNGGPLESEAVRRLFERIIDEARRLERITVDPQAASYELEADIPIESQRTTEDDGVKESWEEKRPIETK
jgi:chorismate mutase